MTTPLDSRTPLLLRSEYNANSNGLPAQTDVSSRQLDAIIDASQFLQAYVGRRLDEYVETRYFTPRSARNGGHLVSGYELALDADLKSLSAITNGDGTSIDTSTVKLLPVNSSVKTAIRLNPYGAVYWYHSGSTDPEGSIQITGTWGMGGTWPAAGATLNGAITSTSATTFVSSAALEVGMVPKVDNEQMYISAVSGMTNTVTRGWNGTTPATHLTGATVYRFKPMEIVQRIMQRLVAVALEQAKAPLFGQVTAGDLSFPVSTDRIPGDVITMIHRSGLMVLDMGVAI